MRINKCVISTLDKDYFYRVTALFVSVLLGEISEEQFFLDCIFEENIV